MAPTVGDTNESQLDIKKIDKGEHNYHANQYIL